MERSQGRLRCCALVSRSIGRPGFEDTREYVALIVFTKLHAKKQVTC